MSTSIEPADLRAALVDALSGNEWMDRHFGIAVHAGDVADAAMEVVAAYLGDTAQVLGRIADAIDEAADHDGDCDLDWHCGTFNAAVRQLRTLAGALPFTERPGARSVLEVVIGDAGHYLETLETARPVLEYVSKGRQHAIRTVGRHPYPDARARKALGMLDEQRP